MVVYDPGHRKIRDSARGGLSMATEPVGREEGATPSPPEATAPRGLTVARRFVPAGTDPYETVEWEIRSAVISGEGGETVFEQRDVQGTKPWTQLATNGGG